MTIVWPMVTGACVTLALINLRIAFGDVPRTPHILFLLSALAVATISQMELALLLADDVDTCNAVLRWASVPIGVMVASVVGFVWSFFGTGRAWIAITSIALHTLAQLGNLLSVAPARQAVAIREVETFGGAHFTLPTVVAGPWGAVEIVSMLIATVFVTEASIALWKRGQRRRALVVGGGTTFFLIVSRGHAYLVENGTLQSPYLVSFAFLAVLIAMGHELSDEVVRASKLGRDLRESERRMDLAARAAQLGFWTWSMARDEIWATETARAMFEIAPGERISLQRFLDTLHPDDREGVKEAIEAAVTGDGEYEKEYRVVLASGESCWIAARGRVEYDTRGKPALMRGVLMDVTAQRSSQDELEQARSQLLHAGRVSMMGQLGSALAHELNQPLGAILRNAETAEILLQNERPDLEELRAILGDIRKDNQRAGDVIDRLRTLLKRRSIQALSLNVADLVEEVLSLARSDAAARNLKLELNMEPDLPLVMGDRVHLQQVLLNLIINAMDALQDTPAQEGRIMISGRRKSYGYVEIEVADNGRGIPPSNLDHVFEPFYTTKPDGMGLGLAISRTIVQAHGGRIVAQNGAEGGAIFRVSLREALAET